jgi:Phosphotransferase enzyme family
MIPELDQAATDQPIYGNSPRIRSTQSCELNAVYATASDDLPLPQPEETKKCGKWFENIFFKRTAIREILSLAALARNSEHKCRFRERIAGGYNVVIFLVFDDGVEWVAKLPQESKDEGDRRNEYLESECSTLMFLQQLGTVPVPKVYDSAVDHNNSVKWPYILMDKVAGIPLINALENGMSKDAIYETLRQLAQVRKQLLCRPFREIGSLVLIDDPKTHQFAVDKQLTISNYFGSPSLCICHTGPYPTSLAYYANLLCIGFSDWQAGHFFEATREAVRERWKIHAYLSSILPSYVKDDNGQFFLAHTDLSVANVLVDEKGSITGIVDWEFASTLPFQAVEHYPLFLADKEKFVDLMENIYEDPLAELQEWREIYAKEFAGDTDMEKYLENIDARIAFEKILHDHEEVTIENLVENCKFLESASTLDHIEIPFPWTSPTKVHRSLTNHEPTVITKDVTL